MLYTHILLIDDDEDDQEIFLSALHVAACDIACTVQCSALDALQQLAAKRLTPDLIFLDLNMPAMNGQQFLVEIKKHDILRDIPIIILSTSSHAATIELTRELGAMDFITKPDKFNELVAILSTYVCPAE